MRDGPIGLLTLVLIVEKSWAKAKALGAETIGVMLLKNIFEMAPPALHGLEWDYDVASC